MKKYHYIVKILVLLIILIGHNVLQEKREEQARTEAIAEANTYLEQTRSANAYSLPEPETFIEELRITSLNRGYAVPEYFEDHRNTPMIQILYGYQLDGKWHDYPSENYNLIGILQDYDQMGFDASTGSHMVKIGQFLLINVATSMNPTESYILEDSIGSHFQDLFSEYHTCLRYTDPDGTQHTWWENHNEGYGYLAENPYWPDSPPGNDSPIVPHIRFSEFRNRYYFILDYPSIPSDYVLTLTIHRENLDSETYELTAQMISKLIE